MQYKINNILYDYKKGIITKIENEIMLTKLQRKLLNYFIDNPNTIISKQVIMENVWGRIITENSVDQFVSILRNHLEKDLSNPEVLVTHFGKGISFEGNLSKSPIEDINKNINKIKYLFIAVVLIVGLLAIKNSFIAPKQESIPILNLNNKMLVLPMIFEDNTISTIEQLGMKEILKSTFTNIETEGQVIFDEISESSKQAIEKHWKFEKKLIVIRTKVQKVGNVYNSVIELSRGMKTFKTSEISANNPADLLSRQIRFISQYQQDYIANSKPVVFENPLNQLYIQAIGYKRNGNIVKAQELIEEVLKQQQNFFLARFTLVEILLKQKQYDKSLSHLQTLKSTSAYKVIGTEIELKFAEIRLLKSEYKTVIEDLKKYQLKHESISEIKKAKILYMIAQAHHALGNHQAALTFYKNALINIKADFYPLMFAKSFIGQGNILRAQSNGQEVYELFTKSLAYAKQAQDVDNQVFALNEMAKILDARHEWEKAIAVQKESIKLLELESDQGATTATGLSTLISIQQQLGHYSDANEMNEKLGRIAEHLDSHLIKLHYLHYKVVSKIHSYQYDLASQVISQHLQLAVDTENYAMQLDNAFLEFEFRLSKKDLKDFKLEWDKRTELIKGIGFERFQIYMDLFLARYYKDINLDTKAEKLLIDLTEAALKTKDNRFVIEAQNYLAEIYLKTDATKALETLNNLEQFHPTPKPYLDLKAQALFKIGKNVEALSMINQAHLTYYESWTAENQSLLDKIQSAVD